MPRATVSNDTERFELKSCDKAFVVLKRLTYGQLLERREMSTQMLLQGGGQGGGQGELKVVQRAVAEFEFRNCIADHNLEDESGELLNFTRPATAMSLDPRIGEEIGRLIDEMNQFEADQGNF